MSNPYSDNDAIPAVPLEYFQQSNGAWLIVVRWAAWVAVAYSAITIAAAVPMVVYFVLPNVGRTRMMMVSLQMILVALLSSASAALLLASAIALLRRATFARSMLIGSCIALVVGAIIQFVMSVFQFSLSGSYRQFGPGFIAYQLVSQFFAMLRSSFVPTILILLFCKPEVKEAT
jgi:hypothetical protein